MAVISSSPTLARSRSCMTTSSRPISQSGAETSSYHGSWSMNWEWPKYPPQVRKSILHIYARLPGRTDDY
jgi:hypothetical protein